MPENRMFYNLEPQQALVIAEKNKLAWEIFHADSGGQGELKEFQQLHKFTLIGYISALMGNISQSGHLDAGGVFWDLYRELDFNGDLFTQAVDLIAEHWPHNLTDIFAKMGLAEVYP